jgi:hypothetical protein
MSHEERELYRSANGDRWCLVRDAISGHVFVKHQPNAPSGGRTTNIEVGEFLGRGHHGPEHQELLRLIGTLVGDHRRVEQQRLVNSGRRKRIIPRPESP